jgi:hypothetical protein
MAPANVRGYRSMATAVMCPPIDGPPIRTERGRSPVTCRNTSTSAYESRTPQPTS